MRLIWQFAAGVSVLARAWLVRSQVDTSKRAQASEQPRCIRLDVQLGADLLM